VIASFLISLGAFFVLLSVVVLAHEYGHYKTGRLLGIGVERFAFGFGPAIKKWRRGEVEFRVNIVPLGGYVKFVGDESERPEGEPLPANAFNAAPVYKRMLTVFAGPAMNMLLAFLVFCVVFLLGFPSPAAQIGDVTPDGAAAKAGLRPGDRIVAIDGKPIHFWQELSLKVAASPNVRLTLTVDRAGRRFDLPITPAKVSAPDVLFAFQTERGSIGVSPVGLQPLLGVDRPDSPAARAGLQTGDVVLTVNDRPVTFLSDLAPALAAVGGQPLHLGVARGEANQRSDRPRVTDIIALPPAPEGAWTMERLGVEPGELYVDAVMPGSPAQAAGFQRGDRLLAVDGQPLASWEEFTKIVRGKPGEGLAVTVRRGDGERTLNVTPRKIEALDALGKKETFGQVGIQRMIALAAAPEVIERYWNPIKIIQRGLQESWTWTVRIIKGIFYLIVGKVPTSSLGGPIAIARMAGESAQMGLIQFLLFTAIISFNLAIINLVPVPIFDGGHLLLFSVEKVIGRPLSERAMSIALRVGIAAVAALFMLIFYNDFRWVFFKIKEVLGA
jgi:regulator of sigma E protease